jgi:type I restriction enzyme S subunit
VSDKKNKSLNPGWRQVKFGDVVRQCKEKADPETSGLERYVAGDHMDTDDLRLRRWGEIGSGYLGPAFHIRFRPGQVLYGSRRTYLRKVAIADFDGICANTTFVLASKDPSELLPEFLPFLMQTQAFNAFSIKNSKGSVNPYINFSDLENFEFALPSIDEQRRICVALHSIEDLIDTYRALELSATHLVRSSVDDLLLSVDDAPKKPLRDLCDKGRPLCYGVVQPGDDSQDGVPLLRVCDLEESEPSVHNLKRITPAIDGQYKRSRVRGGDLLVSIVGTIGRVFLVPDKFADFNIARAIARVSPRPEVDGKYLYYLLSTTQYQRRLTNESVETARKTLNLDELGKLLLPVPPVEQQRQLVCAVDERAMGLSTARERLRQVMCLKSRVLAEVGGAGV